MKTQFSKNVVFRSFLVLMLLGGSVAACSSTPTRESAGEYIDSSAITAKVKSGLVNDPQTSALQISVETFKDTVQLSGFVDTATSKARAEQIARSVEGVRAVKNNLVVK